MSNARRIVIVSSAGLPKEKLAELHRAVPEANLIITDDTADSLYPAIKGAEALIGCPRPLFNAELFERGRETLRWIHVGGAGCEEFFIPELVESDVILTNGRVIQGPEVADHALALLLALTRNLHFAMRGITKEAPRPVELLRKTAAVIGVGGVGMLVAERLHAFGMCVLGVDEQYMPMIRAVTQWYLPERLHEVLAVADVVVLCVPVTDKTRGMFGREEFSVMRPSAYFINVCRGVVVDTDALTTALQQDAMRAAGLDVTDPEPLPADHPLRSMGNVIVTPHRAGLSDNNRERSFELIKQNIERFVRGQPLINVVDKKLGY